MRKVVIAFNGSPRKNWNTATLLKHALEGAASQGVETELIHLYDFDFKGCISCNACKIKGGKSYGKCVQKDELTPILAKIEEVDGFILGSPNYIGSPTGTTRSFIERLVYPYMVYDANFSSLFNKRIATGFIYTMNSGDAWMKQMGYDKAAVFIEAILKMFFGSAESLVVNDTVQFEDYSKVYAPRFDPVAKTKIRAERFPIDCQKAFDMGVRIAQQTRVDA